MEPRSKMVELRTEVREGRSFNPDEFAIALEQVLGGTGTTGYGQNSGEFCYAEGVAESERLLQ